MNQDYISVYEFLEENCPEVAEDLYYSLELLVSNLGYSVDALTSTVSKNPRDFKLMLQVAKYGEIVTQLQSKLNGYLDSLVKTDSVDETIQIVEDDDEKALPDYSKYVVDDEIPHTLMETFTHKKICGFMLNGVRYNVSTWQEALLTLCELLIDKDVKVFETFLSSQLFKGRKNSYFSKESYGNKYYHKLRNANIYVWLNLSTSMICEIMKKMLRGYGISINSLYIYLRADYTPLHILTDDNSNCDIASESQDKIGKYVRSCMRQLSNSGYIFSNDMMQKLTSAEQTKKIFRVGMPFFKEISDDLDISYQTKDSNNRNRYWKEVFVFNGKKFLITSQWFDYSRDNFERWLKELENAN